MKKSKPIYILDNDQPTTCPKCGSRTRFVEYTGAIQKHHCLGKDCLYSFIGEFLQ
jgi:hypothetical protein